MSFVSRVARRYMTRQASPSPSALKLLKVMAEGKGSTSMININLLKEALGLIGWSVDERVGAAPLRSDDQLKRLLADFLRVTKATTWGYDGVKDPKQLWLTTKEDAEAARAILLQKYVQLVPPKGPASAQVGSLYVSTVGAPYFDPRIGGDRWIVPTSLWWLGVPAWAFSSDKGTTAVLTLGIDSNGRLADPSQMKLPSFWTWGYKNGLKAAAAAFISQMGEEQVAALTRPQSARSLDDTGTCPACFENVKITSNKLIMRHGWNVHGHRGWGTYGASWHSSACQGFQWPPFEMSKAGTESYLRNIVSTATNIKARVHELHAGPATLTQTDRNGKSRTFTRPEDYKPGEHYYAYLSYGDVLQKMTQQAERDLKDITEHQRTIEARIAAWEPRPLPGTR